MRDYELVFIIKPEIENEDVTGVVEQVSQFVRSADGEVTSVDVWGRRVLAYPIGDYREGTYVSVQAKLPPAAIADLERNLKLSEELIRYLLVKVES